MTKQYVRLPSAVRVWNRSYLAVLLIFLLGISLRLYDLGAESIWWDEAYAIKVMAQPGPLDIIRLSSGDNNPPLYYLVLHYWMLMAGSSEVAVRLPSAIFGALSIPMLYRIGTLLFSKGAALFAALLLATSTFHIRYSQEARGYSLMVLLTLLSFYFFLKIVRGSGSRYTSIGYVIFTALLMYTHFYGIFFFAAQVAYLLVARQPLGRFIVPGGIAVLLYAPGGVLLAVNLLASRGAWRNNMDWVPRPTFEHLVRIPLIYSGSLPFSLALGVILVLFALYRLFRLAKAQRDMAYLLLAWLLVPIIVPLVASYIYKPMLLERYTIAASPAFYLLATKGFEALRVKVLDKRYVQAFLVTPIALLSLASCFVYFTAVNNEPWRDVASYVDEHAQAGDLVLIYWPEGLLTFDYYSKRDDLDKEGFLASGPTAVT
jgi:mannosyltransferase